MRSALLARAVVLALAITSVAAFGAEFRAGAGKSEIQTSSDMWPLEGYTSMHDQAAVRVLIMDDAGSRFAMVTIETPSISEGVIDVAKAALNRIASVPADHAVVFATHSTSAPHISAGTPERGNAGPGGRNTLPPGAAANGAAPQGGGNPGPGGPGGPGNRNSAGTAAYGKAYEAAVEAAVRQAADSIHPARMGFGVGATSINVSRDLPTPKGWAQGNNSAGFSDKSLPVLRIDGADGNPIAIVMDVSVRSVVMDGSKDGKDGSKALSADLSGAASRYVEQWYGGGTVAFLLMGAAVDQAPVLQSNRNVLNRDGSLSQVDLGETGFTLLDLLGERLGSEAIQAAQAIKATTQPTLDVSRRTLQVPSQTRSAAASPNGGPVQSFTYQTGPNVDFPVIVMRIGDVAIAGTQPELSSSIGAEIKAKSPFHNTMVATMADGGAKYLVDTESFDHFTVEARGSAFGRGAAAVVTTGIDQLLVEISRSAKSK
jgi:hypothetical protein